MIFFLLFAHIIALEHGLAWPRFHNADIPDAVETTELNSARKPELIILRCVRCVTVFAFSMCEFVAPKSAPWLYLRLCKRV